MPRGASSARLKALRKKYGLGEFKRSNRKRVRRRGRRKSGSPALNTWVSVGPGV
jgi:hypothetical protein